MCNCGTEIGTMKHFFLALPIPFQWKKKSLLCLIDPTILSFVEQSLLNALIYGSDSVFKNNFFKV